MFPTLKYIYSLVYFKNTSFIGLSLFLLIGLFLNISTDFGYSYMTLLMYVPHDVQGTFYSLKFSKGHYRQEPT